MEAGAAMAGGIVGLIIGIAIGGVIGGLLIMLGSRIVMGKAATFGSAFVAAVAAGIAGAIIGAVLGWGMPPSQASMAPLISLVIGIAITPFIYAAVVRTSDGGKPGYVQALLIYLVQLAVLIALALIAVFVFRIQIPGVPL